MGFSITEGIGNVLGGAKKVVSGALETATLPARAPLAAVGAVATPLAAGLLGQRGVPMGGAGYGGIPGQPMAGTFATMPGGSPEGAIGMQAALSPYMTPGGTPGVTG